MGVAGGGLWLVALVVEYAFDLFPPGAGAAYTLNQLMFAVAAACYVILLIGLAGSRAPGASSVARIAARLWAAGWCLIAAGIVASLVAPGAVDSLAFLPAVGGLVTAVSALVTGIFVARARAWRGWPRWVPVAVAVYVIAALFVPLALGGEPVFVTEAGWALAYVALGFAVLTGAKQAPVGNSSAAGSPGPGA